MVIFAHRRALKPNVYAIMSDQLKLELKIEVGPNSFTPLKIEQFVSLILKK
jgi:hypothetical protein